MFKFLNNKLGRYFLRKAYNRYNGLFNERFNDRVKKIIYSKNSTEEKLYDEIYIKLVEIYNDMMKDKDSREEVYNREVITLEGKLKYLEQTSNNQSIVFYVALLTLIGGLLTVAEKVFEVLKMHPSTYLGIFIVYFIVLLCILLYIRITDKSSFERGTRVTFYSINLSVIKKIYQEKNENDIKMGSNEKINIDEVAAIVQEEQSEKQVKPTSKQANGNWNITISVPSIIDTIESIYKLGKFARKVFRKKK